MEAVMAFVKEIYQLIKRLEKQGKRIGILQQLIIEPMKLISQKF